MARRYVRSRRKRKPRARKRIDKVQNRRIKRLENATERKFTYLFNTNHQIHSQLANNTDQIYGLIPAIHPGDNVNEMIGNQVSLRSVNVKVAIESRNYVNQSVRVIFFWHLCPVTYVNSAASPGSAPAASPISPNWDSILSDFLVTPLKGQSQFNMISPHQMLSKSNKKPYVILSDRVVRLKPIGDTVANNLTLNSAVKRVGFSKSYKDMKLTFNDHNTTSLGPVNRQLYMAIIPSRPSNDIEDELSVSFNTVVKYTDA